MPNNEILPFGLSPSANLITQQIYAALGARTGGFVSGVAEANEVNKVLRQTAFMAAVVAQFVADQNNRDVLDNGDIAGVEAGLVAAVQKIAQNVINNSGLSTATGLAAEIAARVAGDGQEAQIRAAADASEASARAAADTNEANVRYQQDVALNVALSNAVSTLATQRYEGDLGEAQARAGADAALQGQFQQYTLISSLFGTATGIGGYQKFPSGVIIQWGTVSIPTGAGDPVNFPIAFPNQCTRVVASDANAGCHPCGAQVIIGNPTGFNAFGRDASGAFAGTAYAFIAIGY